MKAKSITLDTVLTVGASKTVRLHEILSALSQKFPNGFDRHSSTPYLRSLIGGLPREFKTSDEFYFALEREEFIVRVPDRTLIRESSYKGRRHEAVIPFYRVNVNALKKYLGNPQLEFEFMES